MVMRSSLSMVVLRIIGLSVEILMVMVLRS